MKRFIAVMIMVCILLTAFQSLAAAEDPSEAMYIEGMEYFEQKDYARAFARFQISGEVRGYAPSQNMLGICYRDGLGTEVDLAEAERLFRLSAAQGYSPAGENLAELDKGGENNGTTIVPVITSVTFKEGEGVILEWNTTEEADEYYKIYFTKDSNSDSVYRNIGATRKNTFTLKEYSAGSTYSFKIRKLLPEGIWSAYSEPKSIKIPTGSSAISVGDIVTFGSYEQDNSKTNGKEPIEWIVLELRDGKALLISKQALDWQQYNISQQDITWQWCSLRLWLNGSFIKEAFSDEEQAKIQTVTINAEKNPQFSTVDPGNNTQDKVFLLSISEAKKYFSSDKERQCDLVASTKRKYYINLNDETSCWWLRSVGAHSSLAAYVDSYGSINNYGCNVYNPVFSVTVWPALWVDFGS